MGNRTPNWRDEASAALLLRNLPSMGPRAPVLVMGDAGEELVPGIRAMGLEVDAWDRRAVGGRRATPWPPDGPFRTIALRLPRAKEELDMALHGAAGSLALGGAVLVYGAKDEGIASAGKRLGSLFENVETIAVGGHCRVVRGWLRESPRDLRIGLGAWREVGTIEWGREARSWVSYPGVFAHGRVDPGTRVLLGAVPGLADGAHVLDYGCGSGVIGARVRDLYPSVRLTVTDIDAVALEAARENVPEARALLWDGLPPVDEDPFDVILSNPPFHRGKTEEPEMIHRLILESPSVLTAGGGLVLVAQRRLPLEDVLKRSFARVALRADVEGFRVWEGWLPRWG